jgi:regulator of replication initiation timing
MHRHVNDILIIKARKMETRFKMLKLRRAMAAQLYAEIKTEDGLVISADTEEITVGTEVFVEETTSGNIVPCPDGTYTCDGKVYTVQGGKVAEVKDVDAQPATTAEPTDAAEEPIAEPSEPEKDDEQVIAELSSENERLKNENKELKEKVAELERKLGEPAAEPAEDNVKPSSFSAEHKEETLTACLVKRAHAGQ